jgi:hypothetical protein
MTKEEQFKKDLEKKIEQALSEDKHNKGVIINDDDHDWGGCPLQYAAKQDLT